MLLRGLYYGLPNEEIKSINSPISVSSKSIGESVYSNCMSNRNDDDSTDKPQMRYRPGGIKLTGLNERKSSS